MLRDEPEQAEQADQSGQQADQPVAPGPATPGLDPVAAVTRLGGLATWQELRALTSRRQVRTAVAKERIVRLRRDCYGLPGADEAVAAARRLGGVVSHLSAAQLHGWKVKMPPEQSTVTVPRRSSGLETMGVEVHWADLDPDDVTDGMTTPLRTVVDCARAYPYVVALCVADSALRSGLSQEELVRAAETSPRTGRARAVRVAGAADVRAANPFESALRGICESVPGLRVEPQQWIGDIGRVDLMDRRLGLAIEAESFEFHSNSHDFGRDVRRYTEFAAAGWVVVRFTWAEVMFDPDYVRRVLTELVARGPRRGAVRCDACGTAA